MDLEVATRIVHALMIAVGDSLLPTYLNTYLRVETAESPGERVLEGMDLPSRKDVKKYVITEEVVRGEASAAKPARGRGAGRRETA